MMSMGDVSKLLRTLESSKPFIIAFGWVCAGDASQNRFSMHFEWLERGLTVDSIWKRKWTTFTAMQSCRHSECTATRPNPSEIRFPPQSLRDFIPVPIMDKTFYPHPDDYHHHSPRMDYLNLIFFFSPSSKVFSSFAKMRTEKIIYVNTLLWNDENHKAGNEKAGAMVTRYFIATLMLHQKLANAFKPTPGLP